MTPNDIVDNVDGTVSIKLTQGKWAIISIEDYPKVSGYRWCAQKSTYGFYAVSGTSGKHTQLHRLITAAPEGMDVDHRDSNGLNNTRDNLRVCTTSQNMCNRNKRKDNPHYKGVSLHKPTGRYLCHINGKHVGIFADPYVASVAYDREAIRLHGEFAKLNHPRRTNDHVRSQQTN